MLDFVFENHTEGREYSEEFFKNVFELALEHLGLSDRQVELGLQLVGSKRMRELNLKHRNKDKPTDVLSFPLGEKSLEQYGIMPLGDIFICLEVVHPQAEEQKESLDKEIARLAVHSLLHLLGYDHERSSKEQKKMIDLQEEILNTL